MTADCMYELLCMFLHDRASPLVSRGVCVATLIVLPISYLGVFVFVGIDVAAVYVCTLCVLGADGGFSVIVCDDPARSLEPAKYGC